MSIPLPHIPVGGRLRHFLPQWRHITSDNSVLDMVRGLHIDLCEFPSQTTAPSPLRFTQEEELATDHLISELLNKNAIVPSEHEPGEFISTIFLRRKSSGAYRLILNLRNFNFFVFFHHFKMDTLARILQLITQECFMGSIDLSDAYLSFFVAFVHQKLLKFMWKNKLYMFVAMPFGLTEAPRKFTKACKAPLAVVRQAGYTIAAYLDDFFQCERTYVECSRAIQFAYNLLVSIGFLPNHKKSVYIPTQRIEALGHVIDSVLMLVSLPPTKTIAIIALCTQAIASPTMSIRHLCTVIGKLISCFLVAPLGKLHYRSLERVKVKALKANKGCFEALCTLSEGCLRDLHWWVAHLPTAVAPISRGTASSVMTTDASDVAWAACFDGEWANGPFSLMEAPFSTNSKEVLAVLYGLKSFASRLANQHILIMSDSTTAVSVVKKMGSMDSFVHDLLATQIWETALEHNIWISITWIPGKANTDSDLASREFSSSTEWALPQCHFDNLVQHFRAFGPVTMDLFASRLNFKVKPYVSFIPDPFSCHVDCFTMSWAQPYILYAYPPFSVWPQVLRKIQEDGATVMAVFPLWTGQLWFNRLLELTISHIVAIPPVPPLYLPWDPLSPHPLGNCVAICSAILSGNPTKQQDFRQTLQTTSSIPLPKRNFHTRDLSSLSGYSFSSQGREIPIVQL